MRNSITERTLSPLRSLSSACVHVLQPDPLGDHRVQVEQSVEIHLHQPRHVDRKARRPQQRALDLLAASGRSARAG